MPPIMFTLMRLSSMACSSSGSEMFCTLRLSSARPYCWNIGSILALSALPNSIWFEAMSMKGTPDSPKMSEMWPTMVLRNWPSSSSVP